jgi:hypothetical protein
MVYYCNGNIFFGHWPLSEFVAHFYFYLPRNGKRPKKPLTWQISRLEADLEPFIQAVAVQTSATLPATLTELFAVFLDCLTQTSTSVSRNRKPTFKQAATASFQIVINQGLHSDQLWLSLFIYETK